ncbi:MAG: hypothetical protein WB816_18565 [Methylocystis sp.]
MRMEFRLLSGQVVGGVNWPVPARTVTELRDQAKTALAGFYEGDERAFWPKSAFAHNAAEEVAILGANGETIASYSVKDMSHDTKRSLVESKTAAQR